MIRGWQNLPLEFPCYGLLFFFDVKMEQVEDDRDKSCAPVMGSRVTQMTTMSERRGELLASLAERGREAGRRHWSLGASHMALPFLLLSQSSILITPVWVRCHGPVRVV